MSIKKLDEAALRTWVARLIPQMKVVGPAARDAGHFDYLPIETAEQLRLDFDVTILPPKKYLLPPRETLLRFSRDGRYEPEIETDPMVLFGVHPYDVVAISQMDAIFARDNRDEHYLARRRNTTIVACDVQNPSANVFAASMGTATVRDGFDELLSRIGQVYLAEARTDRGEELLAVAPAGEKVVAADLARREQLWHDLNRFLERHRLACTPEELPALLEKSEDHPIWKERAERCFSCGSCNLVCPTCYCFDVQDEVDWNLDAGRRVRKWDGCMLAEFALVAGGHNFRAAREARYRHRYYRKGKYLWDRMGQIACVGCGRCISACTADIANPVEVYNTLLEER